MNVFERYAQIGKIKTPAGELPVLEVPQMSDERWQELTRENAVQITLGRTAGNQRAWNRRWHGNGM